MPKHINRLSPETAKKLADALRLSIQDKTSRCVARSIKMNYQTMINKINENSDSHQLFADELITILDNSDSLPFLNWICERYGCYAVPS